MRNPTRSILAAGTALAFALAAPAAVLAKAHDNGVSNMAAEDSGVPGSGGRGSQSANAPSVGKGGLGDNVNEQARGNQASDLKSENSREGVGQR